MKKCLYFCCLFVFVFTFCNKPKACIQVSKTKAAVNEEVTFTSCSQNTHYVEWDFGDGNTMIGDEVTHAYTHAGSFAIRITAHFYEDRKKADHSSASIVIQ